MGTEKLYDDQVGASPMTAEKDKLAITPLASLPKGTEAAGPWVPFTVYKDRIYWRRPVQKKA
jgi:hypothetical protein